MKQEMSKYQRKTHRKYIQIRVYQQVASEQDHQNHPKLSSINQT